jgi:hypothetical protein
MVNLSEAQLLFFRIYRTTFTNAGFTLLIEHYEKYSENNDFMNLLLQVDTSAQAAAKDFFLEKEQWSWLEKLLAKYPALAWTDEDTEKIYSDTNKEDLFWLERKGAEFARESMTLTPKMEAAFSKILEAPNINGIHTVYADNIFFLLILPLLIEIGKPTRSERIDSLSLIKMVYSFLKFGQKQQPVHYPMERQHLHNLLALMQELLNQSNITMALLEANINCLSILSRGAHLKLIDAPQGLLVLNPSNEFEYTLKLRDKQSVVALIKSKQAKSDTDFKKDCEEASTKAIMKAGLFKEVGIQTDPQGAAEISKKL